MQQAFIAAAIPFALAVIMFGMGLKLRIADFTRVFSFPKAASIGLGCQILLLPALAYGLVTLIPLRPEFAIGVLVIALSPGGAVSNLFSLLARGDIALSVTMTAISSSLSVVTVPLLLNLALLALMGEGMRIHLPIAPTMAHIAWITVIPVSLGMVVRARAPGFATKTDRPVRLLSYVFLSLAIVLILLRERGNLAELLLTAGPAAVLLNLVAMALGYGLANAARLNRQQRHTLTIEVGIQNAILATAIAVSPSMLGSTTIAMVPTIYCFTMVVIAFAYIGWALRGSRPEPAGPL